MRPPFETFTRPTCRGSYVFGTACGTCERCEWERAQMPKSMPDNDVRTPSPVSATADPSPDRIAEIRARLDAATPGPWSWRDAPLWGSSMARLESPTREVCNFGDGEQYYPTEGTEPNDADRALIANAPADLAYLLAENATLRQQIHDASTCSCGRTLGVIGCRCVITMTDHDLRGVSATADVPEAPPARKLYTWFELDVEARAKVVRRAVDELDELSRRVEMPPIGAYVDATESKTVREAAALIHILYQALTHRGNQRGHEVPALRAKIRNYRRAIRQLQRAHDQVRAYSTSLFREGLDMRSQRDRYFEQNRELLAKVTELNRVIESLQG